MKVLLDWETRSRINLKTQGMYRYAEDPSTEILCAAVQINDDQPVILSGKDLHEAVLDANEVHAHNAGFERCIWHYILHLRQGVHDIPIHKWRCSAAACSAAALPRDLEGACKALGLAVQKDMEGRALMMKMCKPDAKTGEWVWSPEMQARLEQYCLKDVLAEAALEHVVPPLTAMEQSVWELDQLVNDRGYLVDLEAINLITAAMEKKERELLTEINLLTKGAVTSTRQVAKTKEFLITQGVELDDLRKGTVKKAIKTLEDGTDAKRLLQIRAQLSKASTAKFHAMEKMACSDGRVRGGFVYHGASTGRWAGKGVQPHNLPRESFKEAEFETFVSKLRAGEEIPDTLFTDASKALRNVIWEPAGIMGGDFSSIEGRALAWEAKEQWVIDAYNNGEDLYKHAASSIYHIPYTAVGDESQERQIGKVAELALGYQGWTGAFQAMAVGYGVHVPEEDAEKICGAWREKRPLTKQFWYDMGDAAVECVQTGKITECGVFRFGLKNNFLLMRLPSGRCLRYYDPQIRLLPDKYKREKPTLTYMGLKLVQRPGMSSLTRLWTRIATYGGKLAENATQAVCRDFISEAMLRLELFGYPVILHVHDEANIKKYGSPEEFKTLLTMVPPWATGCPIDAKIWTGRRYRK